MLYDGNVRTSEKLYFVTGVGVVVGMKTMLFFEIILL